MSRPRERIPVSGFQGGFAGAFDSLQIAGGLPEFDGDAVPSPSKTGTGGDLEVKPLPGCLGRLVLSRSKAHRAGKVVICISGFSSDYPDADIESLARRLRSRCGCGGTISGRVVEVQGDQAARVRLFLESEGFHVSGIK